MARMTRLLLAAFVLTFVLSSTASAMVKKMDLADLRDASTDVVTGRVISGESIWVGDLIYTDYTVRVADRVKGTAPEFVTVRVVGGEVGDVALTVYDAASLESGEDVVLFLNRREGVHEVTGWFQGKYSVKNGRVDDTGLSVGQFRESIVKGSRLLRPPTGGTFKKCGYDWTYLGMTGGQYHPEGWEINAANNDGISTGSVNSAIQSAAATWGAAGACFSFGNASTGSSQTGPTLDDRNVVCFGSTGGSIATTYIWTLRSCRKCIAEIDLVFDHNAWNFGVSACGSSNKFDLQSIATHEFGHWLCLGDLYGTGDTALTMYGYADYGDCHALDLASGDVAGIKAIYGTCAGLASPVGGDVQIASDRSAGTTIRFTAPRAGDAVVQIYNVMGQNVATLRNGFVQAGPQSIVWDGRDSQGATVASGIYFAAVRGTSYAYTAKIPFLR